MTFLVERYFIFALDEKAQNILVRKMPIRELVRLLKLLHLLLQLVQLFLAEFCFIVQ